MKVFALVGFLALLGYAAAQCGCLKCSKHLTVIGKTVAGPDCPPATVIYRGAPSWAGGNTLPIRVQTPVRVAPSAVVGVRDLSYKVVNSAPYVNYKVAAQPIGVKYDTKIEVPVPVPTAVTSTTVNLRPCVDRIVLPSPQGGCGRGIKAVQREAVYLNPIQEAPVYREYELDAPVYANPTRSGGNAELVYGSQVYISPIRKSPVYGNPIGGCGCGEVIINRPSVYVNPIRTCGSVATPVYKTETIRIPSGPVLNGPITKQVITRYGKSVYPFLGSATRVDNSNLAFVEGKDSIGTSRCKRELPFLTHGYKFMVNMLPEFLQQPIKNTVNGFAFTHPDKRLQRVYGQPRKPSLKEKLQMQQEKNLALLKNTLRQRHNLLKNPYYKYKPANQLLSGLDYPEHAWPHKFASRSNIVEDDVRSSKHLSDSMRNVNPRKPKLTDVERALLMSKLRKLSDDESRFKRSSTYEKYWLKKYKKPSPKSKSISNLLHSSDIVLPFYHIKEEGSKAGHKFDNHQDVNPWEEILQSSPRREPQNIRYRGRGEQYNNFLEPYSFRHAAAENHAMREDFLRNIIREEVRKNQIHTQEPYNYVQALTSQKHPPHSPIFHVITFPVRLIKKFKDMTKQAFPEVGSLPKMISGTKKYFRDFGRNFRKNVLHLTSDLIGDFENLEITNSILGPHRQRRSLKKTRKVKNPARRPKQRSRKVAQYKPDYSLVFGKKRKEKSEGKARRKRYILKMVDEDEIESYLMEKLGGLFDNSETSTYIDSNTNYPTNYPYYLPKHNNDEENEKKYVLQQLKPKIILDNNGRPFLEINGYKRPVLKKTNIIKKNKLKTSNPPRKFKYYDSSEEVDGERIASLIDHARDHVENNLKSKHSEVPIKTIKEKISQLLFETDILVHLDFERYDEIFDDLIALQHMKTSIVQDWKRLIMTKAINDIGAKISLLERFKELQYYKDLTLSDVIASLTEDNENMFIAKKLIKMLVRLQKLQCLINQVVSNFHDHLHISSNSEIEREIRYVDFLSGLNFATAKSRNDMIGNLKKDRDVALQRNIILLDKLKKLLMYGIESDKVEEEAKLLWEMKNIEKIQTTTIEDLQHKVDAGYKIKKELKILFDLLKRYETCEASQRKLLLKFEEESSETEEEEGSSEEVERKMSKNKKVIVAKKKLNVEELKAKWQERLRKRKMLLQKKLKKNNRRLRKKLDESDEDD